MKFNDLREFVAVLQQLGEIRVVENASSDLEIGAITEVAAGRENSPAVLFDSIDGFPKGYRVLTNITSNRTRERLVFGVTNDMSDREAVKYWKERLKEYKPIAPREVGAAPVKENVVRGDDIDLGVIPWVRWHERDGGPYMCATSVVTRDPDSGFINVGS